MSPKRYVLKSNSRGRTLRKEIVTSDDREFSNKVEMAAYNQTRNEQYIRQADE